MTRIIAGSAKSIALRIPTGTQTRPTTDRVREALFSALASWFSTSDQAAERQLAGISVLDLFAGSGAIGLEAASRGAAPVVCVEHNRAAAAMIRSNAAAAKLQVSVRAERAERIPGSLAQPVDLVVADPPYDYPGEQLDRLIAQLTPELAPAALVVLERSSRDPAPNWGPEFSDHWHRRYGETTLYFATTAEENQ
ncbi:MAG: hypothetical protein CSA64_01235 [Arachnia propionica]|nr:MAG: hypothetical protein CSA64_01235 [Arachnia propionica]